MSLTLLLDLDDTLLTSNVQQWIPQYFKGLVQALKDHTRPELVLPALQAGMHKMMQNQDPTITLKTAFDSEFYPRLGLDYDTPQASLAAFYQDEFPKLQSLTQVIPEAYTLVKIGLERGYRIGIATNPLFPIAAIHHRLRWAGLGAYLPEFLVPSYDTFHFAKPNPAYFAEMLGRMGWPKEPALMVGDEFENDIQGSFNAGLASYWVRNGSQGNEEKDLKPFLQIGNLANLLEWINQVSPEDLAVQLSKPSAILAVLRATPAVLDHFKSEAPGKAWQISITMQESVQRIEWGLAQVFCHLRDVETRVNLPRLKTVLAQDNPFILGTDTDSWSANGAYDHEDGPSAFTAFTQARLETIAILSGLDEKDWNRLARHSFFGPTTLAELMGFVSSHDRLHIQQAKALI